MKTWANIRDLLAHMLLALALRVGTYRWAFWLRYEMPEATDRAGSEQP